MCKSAHEVTISMQKKEKSDVLDCWRYDRLFLC